MPDIESNLVRFIQGKPETYKPFTDHVQAFLERKFVSAGYRCQLAMLCHSLNSKNDQKKNWLITMLSLHREVGEP